MSKFFGVARIAMLLLLTAGLLQGCGFQLRDSYQLPPDLQQVQLAAAPFSELEGIMKERLELAGVEVVRADAPVFIELLDDHLDRRTLSLSASGQVAEYELIYRVTYALQQEQNAPQQFELEVYRDYQDDPNFALAKTRERELLVREMRQEAARRIMTQVIAELTPSTPQNTD